MKNLKFQIKLAWSETWNFKFWLTSENEVLYFHTDMLKILPKYLNFQNISKKCILFLFIKHLWWLLQKAIASLFSIGSFTKSSVLSEALVQRCSVKKVFIKISQNSQENTCARVSFLINFIVFFFNKLYWCLLVDFAKFLRTPIFIERLWRLLLSCFSSLFLTKVTVSTNVSGVMRKSALNCCLIARSFLLFHICWNHSYSR